jgi:hypothetical protein
MEIGIFLENPCTCNKPFFIISIFSKNSLFSLKFEAKIVKKITLVPVPLTRRPKVEEDKPEVVLNGGRILGVKGEKVANADNQVEEDKELHDRDVPEQVVQLAHPWRKGTANVAEQRDGLSGQKTPKG